MDTVFVERLSRRVKYEEIYLHVTQTPREVKTALVSYFRFYNERRPRQGLEGRTPEQMYFGMYFAGCTSRDVLRGTDKLKKAA